MRYLFVFLLIFFFISSSFSYELKDSNCKNLKSLELIGQNNNYLSATKILNKEIYDTALKNLKKYCNGDTIDVLPSDIFVNHLIDVGFRVLDGFWWKYSYWLPPDELAKQRRNYLNGIMKEYETPPQEIKDKFEEIWGQPQENYKANENNLLGRYLLYCIELVPIYNLIVPNTNKEQSSKYAMISLYYNACKNLAIQRYVKESYLVNRIMFMNTYHHINKVLYKWFIQEFNVKWAKLYDKFLVLLWNYEYVVRRFIHATDVQTK